MSFAMNITGTLILTINAFRVGTLPPLVPLLLIGLLVVQLIGLAVVSSIR